MALLGFAVGFIVGFAVGLAVGCFVDLEGEIGAIVGSLVGLGLDDDELFVAIDDCSDPEPGAVVVFSANSFCNSQKENWTSSTSVESDVVCVEIRIVVLDSLGPILFLSLIGAGAPLDVWWI